MCEHKEDFSHTYDGYSHDPCVDGETKINKLL